MSKDNRHKIVFQRAFLLATLPEPLQAKDSHLQIFDNYIENTRFRLRKIRVPETKSWTRVLEQIYPTESEVYSKLKFVQTFLNEVEYKTFEHFKGREIRKNRYFYEMDENRFEIDIYLGKLWGLNIAKIYLETEEELENFEIPSFSIKEITEDGFFFGGHLVDKEFADVQTHLT